MLARLGESANKTGRPMRIYLVEALLQSLGIGSRADLELAQPAERAKSATCQRHIATGAGSHTRPALWETERRYLDPLKLGYLSISLACKGASMRDQRKGWLVEQTFSQAVLP